MTEAPWADSPGWSKCHFPGGSHLSSHIHTPVKLLLWSCFLSPEPPWRTQSLSAVFWITPSLPMPLFRGCEQSGIRINQDSDCKKKAQTNGDKIIFSLEAKGWVVWMNVLGCKNYDSLRWYNFKTFGICSKEPLDWYFLCTLCSGSVCWELCGNTELKRHCGSMRQEVPALPHKINFVLS